METKRYGLLLTHRAAVAIPFHTDSRGEFGNFFCAELSNKINRFSLDENTLFDLPLTNT